MKIITAPLVLIGLMATGLGIAVVNVLVYGHVSQYALNSCTGVRECILLGRIDTKKDCEEIKRELKSHPTISAYICEEVRE